MRFWSKFGEFWRILEKFGKISSIFRDFEAMSESFGKFWNIFERFRRVLMNSKKFGSISKNIWNNLIDT